MSESSNESAPWRYSLFFENDTFFNTDYLYTSGIKISAASPSASSWEELGYLPKKVLPFVNKLPLINSDIDHYSLTYSVGQVIYTPEDTGRLEPSPDDRPYAGAAFLECGLNALGGNRLTSAGFVLGLAGPHSYAEKTQTEIHELIGSNIPEGWNSQMRDTPFVNFSYESSWYNQLWGRPHKLSVEAIPMAGFGIGNAFTFAHTGLQVRMGWNIPFDFGENLIRTGVSKVAYNDSQISGELLSSPWSGYVFAGADGQVVIYDLTLDKSRYDYPYSISSRPFRYTVGSGIGLRYRRYGLRLAHVYSSSTFKEQRNGQTYGTLHFSVAY